MGGFAHSTRCDRASCCLGSGGQFPPLPFVSGPDIGIDGLLLHWPIADGMVAHTMDFDQPGVADGHQRSLLVHPVESRILGLEFLVVFVALALACGPRRISTTQFAGQLFGHIDHIHALAATSPRRTHQILEVHRIAPPHHASRFYRVQVWVSGGYFGIVRINAATGHLDPLVQPPKQTIWVVVSHQLGHGSAAGGMAGKCDRSTLGRFSGAFHHLSPELYSSQHTFMVAISLVGSWLGNIFRKNRPSVCAVDRGWQTAVLHAQSGPPSQRGFIVGG